MCSVFFRHEAGIMTSLGDQWQRIVTMLERELYTRNIFDIALSLKHQMGLLHVIHVITCGSLYGDKIHAASISTSISIKE